MKTFIAEFIGTFILVPFACGTAVIAGPQAGVLGGKALSQLWLFIVAPLVGGAAAGMLARLGITQAD